MSKKSFKVSNLILLILFFAFSIKLQAETINNTQTSTNQELTTTQQLPIINTKTVQAKPLKKPKTKSNSLGVFKLLIPNSLK